MHRARIGVSGLNYLKYPLATPQAKIACTQMHDQYETRCHSTMTLYPVLGSNLFFF